MIRRLPLAAMAGLGAAWAGPAVAQTLGQGADTGVPWLRLGAALLLCLGLAVGAAFALHRRLNGGSGLPDLAGLPALAARLTNTPSRAGSKPRTTRLSDIETRRLSTQVTVSVFRCDGQSFMVAASAQGHLTLVSLDDGAAKSEA